MTSLPGRFERDLLFLAKGEIPLETSGREVPHLEYKGEDHEKLSDEDVVRLAGALLENNLFVGSLELQGNNLTDLAALQLAKAIEQEGAHNITKMELGDNEFSGKAGVYIGSALITNPNYPMHKLSFENVHLEQDGLVRVLEASNLNKNIIKLHCGIVTDNGLEIMAEVLKENTSLEEITFQETKDHQKFWTQRGRAAFAALLKQHTQIKKVKALSDREEDEDCKVFKEEVKFYTHQKTERLQKAKNFESRMESCDQTFMFDNMLKASEEKDKNKNMPVRMFYRNTFGNLINDALFELKKKQRKEPDNGAIFTTEGSVKFVADFCMSNLPEGERGALESMSDDD